MATDILAPKKKQASKEAGEDAVPTYRCAW